MDAPTVEDIAAMRAQGQDFAEYLRLLVGGTPKPAPAKQAPAPVVAEPARRPGAWPAGTRPSITQVAGTPEEWQHAADAYRAWNAAGKPSGDFTCHCGCTPGARGGAR